MTKDVLHSAFLPFGDILEVQLPRDDRQPNTAHRGFGYVEFEEAADALAAIDNMDQAVLAGRVLNVMQAKPQKEGTVLGSKVAVWAQVGFFLSFLTLRGLVEEGGGGGGLMVAAVVVGGDYRNRGWRNMRLVRRIGLLPRRQRRRLWRRKGLILCRVLRDWMLRGLSRSDNDNGNRCSFHLYYMGKPLPVSR